VLAFGRVLYHDRPEVRVVQPALVQPVGQRGEPGDGDGQQAAARPQHPPRLGQRPRPAGQPGQPGQLIQRREQQHRVLGLRGGGQLPRIPERGGIAGHRAAGGRLAGLFHMQRYGIDQLHAIPAAGQRHRVGAGTAADIQDIGRGRRQQPVQQFQRPDEFRVRSQPAR